MPNYLDDDYSLFEDFCPSFLDNIELEYDKIYCNHDWKPILLLFSTVYDCKKCGIKKEDKDKKDGLSK